MRTVVHVTDEGSTRVLDPGAEAPAHGWTWTDLCAPTDAELLAVAERLALDRVSIDDLFEVQSPRIEVLDTHWLVVLHALADDGEALRTVEVDVLIGPDWLVTSHAEALPSFDVVLGLAAAGEFAVDDARHLAIRLTEFVGERYLPLLDELDQQVLDLEDEAVDGDPSVLPEIHALRRDVALLRRVLLPQRRMLESWSRMDLPLTDRAIRDRSDALDHHVRLVDALEASHQMVGTVLDTYRGAAAERMNEVMKTLTVFSAIFLPLTLIAGIYGMNFDNMPELHRPWAYFAVLASMGGVAVALWVYFVRRGFIGGPRIRDLAAPAKLAGRVGRGLASAAVAPILATAQVLTGSDDDGEE